MEFLPSQYDSSQDESATVARIMYASQSTVTTSVYAEMERIRAAAVRHNEPLGVATALLYQSGWFVQWKEGPGSALLRVMDRVAGDPRHHSMRIVHSSRGPRLLSGPWSMAIVQCDESPSDMSRRVLELRRAMEHGVQYPPPAVWRRLSTPMQHPGAARQADPDAFQRVMVCSSEGVAAFEMAQWLAHWTGEELVHRRFAGAQFLDVATDYVDFTHGDRVLRVVAMARNGLQLPLTRAFLPDYSHVILLLGDDDQRNLALMQRVIQACQGLVSPPAMLGVASVAERHDQPYALARRCGHIYLQAEADPQDHAACWAAAEPLLDKWQLAANSSTGPAVELRRVSGR